LHRVSLEDFQQRLRDNSIVDAQTLAAWALYRARRG